MADNTTRKTLLIIDDVEMNRAILREAFTSRFDILEAENGYQGLDSIAKNSSQLAAIFLDIIMPELDGFGVLQELENKELLRQIPVFLITTEATDYVVTKAYDYGIVDVIQKPFNLQIIKRRVMNIIELYNTRNQLETMFKKQMNLLTSQDAIEHKREQAIIAQLCEAIETRSISSAAHIQRVKIITEFLLREIARNHPGYSLSDSKIEMIVQASVLHDIGKVTIPDRILNKPIVDGHLTPEEFEVMKTHTIAGCKILDSIQEFKGTAFYKYAYDICRSHHEKFDGTGYPDGLKGNEIPIVAQVVAIADMYDALISEKAYKPAYSKNQAEKMIKEAGSTAFSPDLLKCFTTILPQLNAKLDSLHVAD
ncbi:MAG: response regulator [Treponema sp.]|nr:response regulator [Treponema sp.]